MCSLPPPTPIPPLLIAAVVQNADSVEEDHLVFDLQPSSPRLRAELQESEQQAALNRQLAQQIPQLDAWPQLQEFVQQHGAQLNFLNVVTLVTRAAALQQVCVDCVLTGLALEVGMLRHKHKTVPLCVCPALGVWTHSSARSWGARPQQRPHHPADSPGAAAEQLVPTSPLCRLSSGAG